MTLLNLTAATGRFAAARRVGFLPQNHPCARLHGHNFQATAFARRVPGVGLLSRAARCTALEGRLQRLPAAAAIRGSERVVAQPTDENLARWIAAALEAPGVGPHRRAKHAAARASIWTVRALHSCGAATNFRRRTGCPTCRGPQVRPHAWPRLRGHAACRALRPAGAPWPAIDYDRLDRIWAPWQERLDSCAASTTSRAWKIPPAKSCPPGFGPACSRQLAATVLGDGVRDGFLRRQFRRPRYRIWKSFTLDSAVRLRRAPAGSGAAWYPRPHVQAAPCT
jgi:6-pyruvoyltetrahydropterin/6-carboxytetrahydropterin synthase